MITDRPASDSFAVAGAPAIPGLVFRRVRLPADLPALAGLEARAAQVDQLDIFATAADLANDLAHMPNADPEHDVVVVEVAGDVVGWQITNWREEGSGDRNYMLRGNIAPEWRRRGLGRPLLRYGERRLRAVAAGHPAGAQRSLRAFTAATRPGKVAMLEREGYQVIRHFYHMLRTGLDDLPEAPLPAGLEFRPVLPADLRTIWNANEEAFRDHWGNTPLTDADFERETQDPDFNPALWNVAWDVATGEVAGVTINAIPGSNAALGLRRGWVYNLSVRRPWRKRGLGRALLVRSLATLRDAGQTEVMLGVDSENITGALRLYEGVGFRAAQHLLAYARPLEIAA